MPYEYGYAMRIFTKIKKVPFPTFSILGHTSVVNVDDSNPQGDSYESF